MSSLKVAIIGGGVAGPTMAIALKRLGMRPTIYEAGKRVVTRSGAGISLSPNGLRMLDRHISSDLYQGVATNGSRLNGGFGIYYSDGACIVNNEMDLKENFGYPVVGIRRQTFRDLCLKYCEKLEIPIHYDRKLTKMTSDDRSVQYEFADGSKDTSDILLGCDGIHSATRKILFGLPKPVFTGMLQVLGLSTEVTTNQSFKTQLSTVFGPEYSIGTYSLEKGTRMWFTKKPTDIQPNDSWTSGSATPEMIEEVRNSVQDWMDPIPELINNTQSAIYWGIFDRPPLDHWHTDRIALLGDACHPMAPHLGQGANTSLEDVAVLSSLLVDYPPDVAFAKYQSHRLPRTTLITKSARNMGSFGYTTNPLKRSIRDPILKLLLGQFQPYLLRPVYGYECPTTHH